MFRLLCFELHFKQFIIHLNAILEVFLLMLHYGIALSQIVFLLWNGVISWYLSGKHNYTSHLCEQPSRSTTLMPSNAVNCVGSSLDVGTEPVCIERCKKFTATLGGFAFLCFYVFYVTSVGFSKTRTQTPGSELLSTCVSMLRSCCVEHTPWDKLGFRLTFTCLFPKASYTSTHSFCVLHAWVVALWQADKNSTKHPVIWIYRKRNITCKSKRRTAWSCLLCVSLSHTRVLYLPPSLRHIYILSVKCKKPNHNSTCTCL